MQLNRFERTLDVQQAIALAREEWARLGLSPVVRPLLEGSYGVMSVVVEDENGDEYRHSYGKGAAQQCLASALFEGLEHAALRRLRRLGEGPIPWEGPGELDVLTAREAAAQGPLAGDRLVQRLAHDHPDVWLHCARLRSLIADAEPLWYPVFRLNPFMNEYVDPAMGAYLRYSCNNGAASGATEAEALLHGLLEVVERDAVSLALLGWFGKGARRPLRVLRADALSEGLRQLSAQAERVLGCPPLIIDVTTDLKVPVFFALPSQPTRFLAVRGAGASLNREYAIERALGELMESIVVASNNPKTNAKLRERAAALRRWPLLADCVELNPERVLRDAPVEEVRLWPTPVVPLEEAPEGQLARLAGMLAERGHPAWCLRWNAPDARVAVTSVVAPGLENIINACKGIALLPTGRGWGLS